MAHKEEAVTGTFYFRDMSGREFSVPVVNGQLKAPSVFNGSMAKGEAVVAFGDYPEYAFGVKSVSASLNIAKFFADAAGKINQVKIACVDYAVVPDLKNGVLCHRFEAKAASKKKLLELGIPEVVQFKVLKPELFGSAALLARMSRP